MEKTDLNPETRALSSRADFPGIRAGASLASITDNVRQIFAFFLCFSPVRQGHQGQLALFVADCQGAGNEGLIAGISNLFVRGGTLPEAMCGRVCYES